MRTLAFDVRQATSPCESSYHGGLENCDAELLALANSLPDKVRLVVMADDLASCEQRYGELAGGRCRIFSCRYGEEHEFMKRQGVVVYYNPLGYGAHHYDLRDVTVVIRIHGLRYVELPFDINLLYVEGWPKFIRRFLFAKRLKQKALRAIMASIGKADLVICSSLHTKYSLLKHCDWLSHDKLLVYYCPSKITPSPEPNEDFFRGLGIEKKKYYLAISMGVWTKNPYRLYRAVKRLESIFKDRAFRFVFVGVKKEKHRFIQENDVVRCCNYLPPHYLEALYKNAYAFVYPTLNEGFGYPPLEAMKYGVPVAASMVSSVTEICGGAVLGFNPYSIDEIENRLLMLLCEEQVYRDYAERALQHYSMLGIRQAADLKNFCSCLEQLAMTR